LDNKDFYFTELSKQPVMKYGLNGEIVQKGEVILKACNTDWSKWNSHAEFLKTAAVYRSERESKAEGAAIVKVQVGKGQLYLNSVDLMLLKADGEELIKTLLKNLGVQLNLVQIKSRKALSSEARLERAMVLKIEDAQAKNPNKMGNQQFSAVYETESEQRAGSLLKVLQSNAQGFLDLDKVGLEKRQVKQEVYLSFWLFSPRSLVNLLVEPDIPKLNMFVEGRNAISLSINGIPYSTDGYDVNQGKLENLPLEKGWNHILVKLAKVSESRGWLTIIRFESNNVGFLSQLNSSVGQ
jgi:hypothetical protein